MKNIENYEKKLVTYAYERLSKIKEIEIYGPDADKRSGLVSFNVKNAHAHDTATI